MFDKAYKERCFVLNRDEMDYLRRQAASCKYLERLLDQWIVDTDDPLLRMVLRFLTEVHLRQYDEIGLKEEASETSFYFDELYKHRFLKVPRIAIHAVSYNRGMLRYSTLISARSTLWPKFNCDAWCNREICKAYMVEKYGPTKTREYIEKALELEAEVMQKIDERNRKKGLT